GRKRTCGCGRSRTAHHRPARTLWLQRHSRSRAMSDDNLSERLEAYLANVMGIPDLEVANLSRIPGGASRETYRFRARHNRNGTEIERGLILRRDQTTSLIETERATEFRAYRAFHSLGLPVPEPIALEESSEVLDRPFFVMEEIENCQVGSILSPDPY